MSDHSHNDLTYDAAALTRPHPIPARLLQNCLSLQNTIQTLSLRHASDHLSKFWHKQWFPLLLGVSRPDTKRNCIHTKPPKSKIMALSLYIMYMSLLKLISGSNYPKFNICLSTRQTKFAVDRIKHMLHTNYSLRTGAGISSVLSSSNCRVKFRFSPSTNEVANCISII